jgi:hypothetical protein
MNSTKDVIENHIRRFREGNIKGVLDDFSPDAILPPHWSAQGYGEITDECSPKQTSRRFRCIRCQILAFVPDASVHSVPCSG